jgi:hypothetical protein
VRQVSIILLLANKAKEIVILVMLVPTTLFLVNLNAKHVLLVHTTLKQINHHA